MRETVQEKAVRLLCERRVRILECHEDAGALLVDVRGDRGVYSITFEEGALRCDCPARARRCAHVQAVEYVVTFAPRESQP
jgi:hypothetical protein